MRRCAAAWSTASADEVVLLGRFDGVSAMRVAWQNLGLGCLGHVAIDNCPHAKRVLTSEWPDALRDQDVRKVDERQVEQWRGQFPGACHILSVADFPCHDLTSAHVRRRGLAGSRSSLFWEQTRLWKTVACVWRSARLHRCAENVQRMPANDEWAITNELGVPALAVCGSLFSWTNRP